jgi:hypothetical protein
MFKYPENAGLQRLQYPPAMTRTYPCHDDPGRYQQNCGEDAHTHQPLPQQILVMMTRTLIIELSVPYRPCPVPATAWETSPTFSSVTCWLFAT